MNPIKGRSAALALASLFVLSHPLSSPAAHAATGSSTDIRGRHSVARRSTLRLPRDADANANVIGLLAGPGFASAAMSGADAGGGLDSASRAGVNGQIYYEHRFVPYFGAQGGVRYAQRGFTVPLAGARDSRDLYAVDYLEFPFGAKAMLPLGPFTPYVAMGPYLGVAMAKGQSSTRDGVTRDAAAGSLDRVVRGTAFGLDFGGGTLFEVARGVNIELNLRYSLGLTSVLTDDFNGTADRSLRLNSLQLTSGLAIAL